MKMSELPPELKDRMTMAAQKLAMANITASIANGYLEDAFDDFRAVGIMHRDVKFKAGCAVDYFDKFNSCVKWFFELSEGDTYGRALCEDYEILQDACDGYMRAGVRVSAYDAWNNDDLRQDDIYLCRVEGAKDTDVMLLRWQGRQWLTYCASQYGSGWVALNPGVKVAEVVKRIGKGDIDPMERKK